MNIQLSTYRNNFTFIKTCYEKRKHNDISFLVSEISSGFPIPCIVVAYYLKELGVDGVECDRLIEIFMKTYQYGKVEE